MNNLKQILIVPKGIRFISEWTDFDLPKLEEKCIINKKIPGCGMTEYYLTNQYNVILASPRKILLQNKFDQHPSDVFLVKNEEELEIEVDREFEEDVVLDSAISSITSLTYQRIQRDLNDYIDRRTSESKPIKILVTYDSYHIVKDILKFRGNFSTFYTMVDEFQCLLNDSKFKSNTEILVMSSLKDVDKVHFVSATPMIDKYLEKIDEFSCLIQYIFDWSAEDPLRVLRPNLKVRIMDSVGKAISPIIQKYKNGEFDKITSMIKEDPEEIVSDEAIFYVNSVNHIISAIKKNSLTSEQVNILCADTQYNRKRIKDKLGKEYTIGTIPLKGEKPKMFTFCTRTVYLGADFYSSCAQSFIFSDSNYDCLAIDISLDLPQILGRQRNDENPWKNSATLFYKSTANWRKMSKDDFDRTLQDKIEQSNKLLESYRLVPEENKRALSKKYESDAKRKHYENDYVAVTNGIPVFNNMYYVSEMMSFDIQQVDYADRFSVFSKINEEFFGDFNELNNLLNDYHSLNNVISTRLKFICKLHFDKNPDLQNFLDILPNDDYAKSYYYQLGPECCRARGYQISNIKNEIQTKGFDQDFLKKKVYEIFHEGDKKTKEEIKTLMAALYSSIGYNKTAKAVDIEDYFDVSISTMLINHKKRVNCLKLNKKKEV